MSNTYSLSGIEIIVKIENRKYGFNTPFGVDISFDCCLDEKCKSLIENITKTKNMHSILECLRFDFYDENPIGITNIERLKSIIDSSQDCALKEQIKNLYDSYFSWKDKIERELKKGNSIEVVKLIEHHYEDFSYDDTEDVLDGLIKEIISMHGIRECEGANVVITGKTIDFENHAHFKQFIEKRGGHVQSSINSKTDYIICNNIDKYPKTEQRAKEYKISILTEEDFIRKMVWFIPDEVVWGNEIEWPCHIVREFKKHVKKMKNSQLDEIEVQKYCDDNNYSYSFCYPSYIEYKRENVFDVASGKWNCYLYM